MSDQDGSLEGQRINIIRSLIACSCVVFVFVCLRIYTRLFLTKRFTWDDCALLLSFLSYLVFNFLCVAAFGRWNSTFSVEQLEVLMNEFLAAGSIYVLYAITFRISLILFFLPFTMHPWQRRFLISVGTVYTLGLVGFFFVNMFRCGPPQDQLVNIFANHCSWRWYGSWTYLICALNSVTDWLFALLPTGIIWNVNMKRADRIATCALMLLAASGSIASIVRLVYVGGLNPTGIAEEIKPASVYSVLAEMSCGFVSVCCATCRPLVVKLFGHWRHGKSHSLPKGSGPVVQLDSDGLAMQGGESKRKWETEKTVSVVDTSSRSAC